MDKPNYLGFSELSTLLLYETYCDKLQAYYGKVNISYIKWILIASF